MVYNIYEKPTIEVMLSDFLTDVFFSNLSFILSLDYMDRILFRCESRLLNIKIIHAIEELISKFNKKYYIIDNQILSEMSQSIQSMSNVVPSQYIFNNDLKKITSKDFSFPGYNFLCIDLSIELTSSLLESLSSSNILHIQPQNNYLEVYHTTPIFPLVRYYKLLEYFTNSDAGICLSNKYKVVKTIREHPCNAYLCAGDICHSGKSSLPRYWFIDKNGIMPYNANNKRLMFLSTINRTPIFDLELFMNIQYKNSEAYSLFIEANHRIYEKYIINFSCLILPWNIMLDKVLQDNGY